MVSLFNQSKFICLSNSLSNRSIFWFIFCKNYGFVVIFFVSLFGDIKVYSYAETFTLRFKYLPSTKHMSIHTYIERLSRSKLLDQCKWIESTSSLGVRVCEWGGNDGRSFQLNTLMWSARTSEAADDNHWDDHLPFFVVVVVVITINWVQIKLPSEFCGYLHMEKFYTIQIHFVTRFISSKRWMEAIALPI